MAPEYASTLLIECRLVERDASEHDALNRPFPRLADWRPRDDRLPEATSGNATEGSWVRLSGSDELSAHAGKRVTITGAIVDSGQNTVGTAGTSGNTLPSGDRSEAASSDHHSTKVKKEAGRIARESMANGTAAEVKVSSIQASGESCEENAGRK